MCEDRWRLKTEHCGRVYIMSSVMPSDGANSDFTNDFVNGDLRKKLGLNVKDLRVGLDVAQVMLQRDDTSGAMRIYLALVLCEPKEVDFQVGLANCALLMNEPHVALQAASVVIALSPRDPRGYFLSGRSCMDIGSRTEAKEDFADAIRWGKAANDAGIVAQAQVFLDVLEAKN
jgi:predicted Zn-dependent protease